MKTVLFVTKCGSMSLRNVDEKMEEAELVISKEGEDKLVRKFVWDKKSVEVWEEK